MFGHVKGAFTGASARNEGIIQAAKGGTLFLDEIDSIPLLMQAKLLRLLEEKEFKQLGMNRIEKADVRIIAAARCDLRGKVQDKSFRDDLFYRLNVVSLHLPPLRERADDIPLLADHFLSKYSVQLSKPISGFGPGVLPVLMKYDWPGNIRELENAIYRSVAMCQGSYVELRDLNLLYPTFQAHDVSVQSFKKAKADAVANFERHFIACLLAEHNGNISSAARAAQKHRRAFWQLMKKHGMKPNGAFAESSDN